MGLISNKETGFSPELCCTIITWAKTRFTILVLFPNLKVGVIIKVYALLYSDQKINVML
jgi:hypothetical protein